MKCKKCGNELDTGTSFCANCGEKVEPENNSIQQPNNDLDELLNANVNIKANETSAQSLNKKDDKKSSKKKVIFLSIIGIVAIIAIAGFFLTKPRVLNMEVNELSKIIANDEAKDYAGDTIYLHGFLVRDLESEKAPYLYALSPTSLSYDQLFTSDSEEAMEAINNMVYFVIGEDSKQLDSKLGTSSELILKGKMGESSGGITVLIVDEIEVKEKVDPVSSLELSDLNDSYSDYIDKDVMLMGRMVYIFGTGHYLTDSSAENFVKLSNFTEDQFANYYKNGSGAFVTGKLKQEDEELVIDLEKIIQNESTEDLFTYEMPTVSDCYESSIEDGTVISVHGIYKRDVTGSVSHAIVDEDTSQFVIINSNNIDLDKYFEIGKDYIVTGVLHDTGRGYLIEVQAIG